MPEVKWSTRREPGTDIVPGSGTCPTVLEDQDQQQDDQDERDGSTTDVHDGIPPVYLRAPELMLDVRQPGQ
jgi:hypothetical protein